MRKITIGYLKSLSEQEAEKEAILLVKKYNIDYQSGFIYCGRSIEAYCEILQLFCELYLTMYMELISSLRNGNSENYRNAIHALKGNALSIGASQLARISLEHEEYSRKGDLEWCEDDWDNLLNEWRSVILGSSVLLVSYGVYEKIPSYAELGVELGD